MDAITIGVLGRRAGVLVETIRYYERVGLLPRPARTRGGYRRYGLEDAKRLTLIRRARELGFSLAEIRALLSLANAEGRRCADARAIAEKHIADIRTKIADLQTMKRILDRVIVDCRNGRMAGCPLLDALFRG
jgi:MerR family mercuric resistance operon transcriptional regulator